MSRFVLAPLLALAVSLPARADAPAPLSTDSEATAAARPANRPAHPLATSPATAAKLSAGLPHFAPQPPAALAKPGAPPEPPDAHDADLPRNKIIRLPRYEVTGPRVPAFKQRELLTPEGRVDLAFKRHPGLKIGNFFNLNAGVGLAMLGEEEAYERRVEMANLVGFLHEAEQLSPPAKPPDAPKPAAASQ